MHCLIVMRRGGAPAAACCLALGTALQQAGCTLDALFLLGPGVQLAQEGESAAAEALRAMFPSAILCCGRALQEHQLPADHLPPGFAAAGYFELLHRMAEADRVIEL